MDTASSQPIRVLIVDDHRVLTELLTSALSMSERVTVVGSVGTAIDGVRQVASLRPDVVLLDYDLPDGDGVSVVSAIIEASPGVRVLMLTSYTDPVVLSEAMEAGCSGFITKRNGASEILAAVLAVASDETPVSPDMVRALVAKNSVGLGSDLTAREIEVLRIAAKGLSNKEIAAELYLSVNTVRNHMQHVLNKLGAHSKLEATAIATRIGILRR
ncbi:response regulator transcription factor [Ilumatobacter coccineus]|uniref:Putative NarL family two-component response regulator n=1 Tax=Ilumatobacter coccineus (strain NBRC 103263 / KCTC 29153 / YM16-304) TaxID=1313172 RepID=A0A6C7EBA4_ILUCY|nr:response regulator transcription factor [Ilumatobacter coccineus]BAN01918.1 putative NarL family two-component response regulator [Ilumatobacter coccineus YM16-304]